MIQLSTAYRAALESGAEQNIRLTFENGEILDKAQISATGGFRYRQILNGDGDMVMGRAIQSTAEVELLNIDGYLDGFDFSSEFTVEYGVNTGSAFEYVTIGKFKGGKASRIKSKTIMLTGVDRMRLFDRDASEFITQLELFPIKLDELLQSLCYYVGIYSYTISGSFSGSFSSRTIEKNPFTSSNHTCREILEWIAEAMCGYAVITPAGELSIIYYEARDITVARSRRFEMAQSEFETPQIGKIEVYTSYSDRLISEGIGGELYVIRDNPFLYAENDEDVSALQSTISDLLSALMQLYGYYPASFRALTDPSIECGDVINVIGDDGKTYSFPVMMRTIEWSGIGKSEYECTGNEHRETVPVEQRELENLKKDMVRTTDLYTEIDSYIRSEEGTAGILISVGGKFATKDEISGFVTTEEVKSSINTAIDEFGAKLELKVENGERSSTITLRKDTISLSSQTIKFTGDVVFASDLSTAGATTINGANVTTDNLYVKKIFGDKGTEIEDIMVFATSGRNIALGNGNTEVGLSTNLTVWANNIVFASRNNTLNDEYLVISTPSTSDEIEGIRYLYPCCIYPYSPTGSTEQWDIGNSDFPFNRIYIANSMRLYDQANDAWTRIYVSSSNGSLYWEDWDGNTVKLATAT